jgi:predicted ribosome quality control (RQC) complex YloA/Tae2 family protein
MTIELSEEEDKSESVNKVKDYKSKIMKTSKQIEDTYFFIQKIKQQLLRLENGQKQIAGKDILIF